MLLYPRRPRGSSQLPRPVPEEGGGGTNRSSRPCRRPPGHSWGSPRPQLPPQRVGGPLATSAAQRRRPTASARLRVPSTRPALRGKADGLPEGRRGNVLDPGTAVRVAEVLEGERPRASLGPARRRAPASARPFRGPEPRQPRSFPRRGPGRRSPAARRPASCSGGHCAPRSLRAGLSSAGRARREPSRAGAPRLPAPRRRPLDPSLLRGQTRHQSPDPPWGTLPCARRAPARGRSGTGGALAASAAQSRALLQVFSN